MFKGDNMTIEFYVACTIREDEEGTFVQHSYIQIHEDGKIWGFVNERNCLTGKEKEHEVELGKLL